ncbi:MAG: hypothetical protein IKC89_04800 [Lentisphaeria bacterium]|nr:hypothetical protein [Lentisphaeria bacterium]
MKKILSLTVCSLLLSGCVTNAKFNKEEKVMKKSYYFDLMEKTLSAYSMEHIDRYFEQVKREGLTEHGFPRLTANIGILIAHGRRTDLKERFLAMMDFCCQQIPKVIAANEFSIKEIIFCMEELEKVQAVPNAKLEEWKNNLKTADPYNCYSHTAKKKEDIVHNWAAFGMLSEYMRKKAGITNAPNDDFIDLQAYSQIRHIDANGMYRDPGCPMVYDFVTRGLFALLLHEGYQGQYKDIWQNALERSAIATLEMISVNGELPVGGRSHQFLHNEAHVALMMEFYAGMFARKGDMETAGKYRTAAVRALKNISSWLNKNPISHIRNRFPIESKYGCEKYAYFDKYMITAASFLYAASRFCDESIPPVELDDNKGMTLQTSDDFHMLFLRAGEYSVQYDYDARQYYNGEKYYDCSGVTRIHKKGAPSEICMSVSCPGKSSYSVDIKDPFPLSIAPGVCEKGQWIYATDMAVKHTVKSHSAQGNTANAEVECSFPGGETVTSSYTLNSEGLTIRLKGSNAIRCLLPVFRFNGETHTKVQQEGNKLTIEFEGYVCTCQVLNGTLKDLEKPARNRNGHYDAFAAEGKENLTVKISIEKL